jgi:hypothetical protein
MRLASIVLLFCSLLPITAFAQQGHPLAGIWLGDWGPSADERHDVVLELNWHDTTLSGYINPGFPDAATITRGDLDSSDWSVHIEGDSKDAAGNTVKVIVDGRIDNLGSPNRTLSGGWRRGSQSGTFALRRE